MSRLIDADALKEYIDCGHLRSPCEVCFSELDVVNLIDAQPTIDAVPVKRGKWTVTPIYIKCSECGESFMLMPQNYCPNCGCRMDAEDDKWI